jgi:hypothetical protein
MTFAEELTQVYKTPTPKAPPPAAAAVAPAAETTPAAVASPQASAPVVKPALEMSFDLPAGDAPIDPAAKKVEPVKVETPPVEVKSVATPLEAKKSPIKIGNKEFETIESALDYAKEIERAAAEDKAYIEGVKDAAKKPAEVPAEPVESPYEKFSKAVFEDPVKAAREFSEAIKQDIRDEYNNSIKAQAEQARVQQQRSQAWDGFFKTNTDLSEPDTREMIQTYLVNKHWAEIKDMEPQKGFEKLANIARKALKISQEAALPTRELASGPVVTTGANGEAAATPTPAKVEENLDFVTQVNNLRRRKR